jgi:hypothetical protein
MKPTNKKLTYGPRDVLIVSRAPFCAVSNPVVVVRVPIPIKPIISKVKDRNTPGLETHMRLKPLFNTMFNFSVGLEIPISISSNMKKETHLSCFGAME